MSSVRDYLVGQIDKKLLDCKSIQEKAEEQGRSTNDVERAEIEKALTEVKSLRVDVDSIDKDAEFKKAIDDARGPVVDEPEQAAPGKSLASAFLASEGFQRVKSSGFTGNWKSGSIDYDFFGSKTTVTEAASAIAQPTVVPGIMEKLAWPTRVIDLFAGGTTDSNTVRYIEELANTNAAAGVSEGSAKPESAITFDQKDTTVGKIATFLPVSDEMLEDVAQMESFLNIRLASFVKRKEDNELLNGTGAPSVLGLLGSGSGIQTGSALSLDMDTVIDSIFQAMTLVQTGSFLEADGIIMHPTDWAAIRLLKDANKQYYGGGPFTGAYGVGGIAGPNLWGLPIVVTTAIAVGTILVGKFGGGEAAQIFRRRGLTVEASNGYNDFFQRNLTAFRAEERLALVLYRPTAFYAITGANLLEGS